MRNVVCCLICLFKIMVERLYCLFIVCSSCFEFVCKNDGLMSGGWVVFEMEYVQLIWDLINFIAVVVIVCCDLFGDDYVEQGFEYTHWWSGFLFFFFLKEERSKCTYASIPLCFWYWLGNLGQHHMYFFWCHYLLVCFFFFLFKLSIKCLRPTINGK